MLTVTFPAGTSTRQGGPAAPLGRPAMTDTHSRAVISSLQPSASVPPPATFTSVDSDVTRQAADQRSWRARWRTRPRRFATSRSSLLSSDPTSPVATAVTVAAAAAAAVMAARGNIDEVNGSYPQQEAPTPLHAIEQQLLVRARARARVFALAPHQSKLHAQIQQQELDQLRSQLRDRMMLEDERAARPDVAAAAARRSSAGACAPGG